MKKILKQKYILEELEKAGEDAKKLWKVLNFLIGKKHCPEKIEPEELNWSKQFQQILCKYRHWDPKRVRYWLWLQKQQRT